MKEPSSSEESLGELLRQHKEDADSFLRGEIGTTHVQEFIKGRLKEIELLLPKAEAEAAKKKKWAKELRATIKNATGWSPEKLKELNYYSLWQEVGEVVFKLEEGTVRESE